MKQIDYNQLNDFEKDCFIQELITIINNLPENEKIIIKNSIELKEKLK